MLSIEMRAVAIDQLPAETTEGEGPWDAVREVRAMLANSGALRRLHDEEPVQIERANFGAWGRNPIVGAFCRGDVAAED